MRRKLVATFVVLAALLCLGTAALIFWWQGRLPIPFGEPVPEVAESPAPDAILPQATAPAPAPTANAPKTPVEPGQQPSFDIVRIEPTGEGVIAGRAEPGWKVSVESDDAEVAEVVTDEQGEWTVVLEKPLSGGSHVLSLKATSPDGAHALSSSQAVATAVPTPATKSAAMVEQAADAAPKPGTVLKPEGAQPRDLAPEASAPQTSAAGVPATGAAKSEPAAGRRAVAPGKASGAALPQTAAVNESEPLPPRPLAEQKKPGVYTILPGDTLWDIAQRYLGAGWRYPSIYRDNRGVIRNPDLIHPDQRVKVPDEP
jgi:nucleoid-associated protein YgaU